jgi:hypothetical protein
MKEHRTNVRVLLLRSLQEVQESKGSKGNHADSNCIEAEESLHCAFEDPGTLPELRVRPRVAIGACANESAFVSVPGNVPGNGDDEDHGSNCGKNNSLRCGSHAGTTFLNGVMER